MKYLLALLIIVSCTFISSATTNENTNDITSVQYNDTNFGKSSDNNTAITFDYKNTKEWKRYKTLRAVGWCALGLGIPTTFVGGVLIGLGHVYSGGDPAPAFIAILSAGGTLTLSSIPLLICAYHNRSKAKKLAVGLTSIHTPDFSTIPTSNRREFAPALSLNISF